MASTGEAWRLGRRPALDGLRGIAALVVLLVHVLLANTWLAVNHPEPLQVAGFLAVMVFFVLSGYVLTRPYIHGGGRSWRSYYPSRLLRLYVPVWGALAFALLLASVVPRAAEGGNWWIDYSAGPFSMQDVAVNASLWRHGALLNQLWSLKWEVAFSLLLPAYVAACSRLARRPVAGFLGLALAAALAHVAGWESVEYLSVFGFGSMLAAVEPVEGWQRPYGLAWLASTPSLWLGRVSFSLYLIHLPVVLAVHQAGGPWWALSSASVALSLGSAEVFYRLVEAPSQRLAARVKSRTSADLADVHVRLAGHEAWSA